MADLVEELRALIESVSKTERACKEFLKYVPQLLFRETVLNPCAPKKEYRSHSGDSDYIVYGKVKDESGYECVRAYIWETKAPQCHIFRQDDNKTRVRPTRDFIKAETQLLNYHYDLSSDLAFRDEFEISSGSNVRIGGIIIGSNRTLIEGVQSTPETMRRYKRAASIRQNYLYDSAGIRFFTWDKVLEYLQPPDMIENETRGLQRQ